MSVQLALLKSGEDVIADIKEYRDSDDNLVSYLFKDPFTIKIKTSQLLVEDESTPKHEVIYYKWISLSKDTDIVVNPDWVVCITDPLDSIRQSYEERLNARRSRNDSDQSSNGRDVGTIESSGESGTESSSSTLLTEQLDSDSGD
tara:strand:- start:543 stop:977 length:435 start_codon:yes stop_codon:yes gene_type:complete